MPKQPVWNKIEFDTWSRHEIEVSTNSYADGPVILKIYGNNTDILDLDDWMTPEAARELASKLIEAADAVDRAGRADGA